MAQEFDVSLKSLFRHTSSLWSTMLFGVPVDEWLNVEQPLVSNRRADLLARTADGLLRQLEFQSGHDGQIALRMAEYYLGIWRIHRRHVDQVVLYVGPEPIRMPETWQTPTLAFRFRIVNIRDLDGGPLLESPYWGDNALALLTNVDISRALEVIFSRIDALNETERGQAAQTIVLLSGLIGREDEVDRRLRQSMIDILQNKILGPALREGMEKGQELGAARQREQAKTALRKALRQSLRANFGELSPDIEARLDTASYEELEAAIDLVPTASHPHQVLP